MIAQEHDLTASRQLAEQVLVGDDESNCRTYVSDFESPCSICDGSATECCPLLKI